MTQLPVALRPWQRYLALFPDSLAQAIGGIIPRLAVTIGHLDISRDDRSGEPDGYDGLSARGSFERLLISQWALAEEYPEEFLRRAVSRELVFLQVAHRSATTGRRCLALFDSGAEQLGAPRVAQLAALIVLAQRADDAGAAFEWGIVQHPAGELRQGLSQTGVMHLLESRTIRPMTEADGKDWSVWLSQHALKAELWMVGGPSAARQAPKDAGTIEITDDLEDQEVLRVAVTSPRRPARSVSLPMPDAAAAVRLLRDPFGVTVAAGQRLKERLNPAGTLVFADDGRKIHACDTRGALLSLPIPNSPKAGTGKPGVFQPPRGHVILAVGQARTKKRTIALTQGDGALHWHTLSKRGNDARTSVPVTSDPGLDWSKPRVAGRLTPLVVFDRSLAFFVDEECRLVRIRSGVAEVVPCGGDWVLEARRAGNHLVGAMVDGVARCRIVMWSVGKDGALDEISRTEVVSDFRAGFFLGSQAPGQILAWASGLSQWTVRNGRSDWVQTMGLGERAIGIIEDGYAEVEAKLAVLDADRRRLIAVRAHGAETLVVATDTIAHAAVSPVSRHLAWVTASGELFVYSQAARAVVARASPGDAT